MASPDLHAPPTGERLTRAETAARLDVSTQTVDRYADARRLTRHKNELTLRVYFTADEVEQVRRGREEGPR